VLQLGRRTSSPSGCSRRRRVLGWGPLRRAGSTVTATLLVELAACTAPDRPLTVATGRHEGSRTALPIAPKGSRTAHPVAPSSLETVLPEAAKNSSNVPKNRKAVVRRPDHIVVVIFENRHRSTVIGNSRAPYLNKLAGQGANVTRSYGVTHPSQPNYLALFSGSTHGVTSNACLRRLKRSRTWDPSSARRDSASPARPSRYPRPLHRMCAGSLPAKAQSMDQFR
jgi:hypothetical protein